jgi:hypothetical protein
VASRELIQTALDHHATGRQEATSRPHSKQHTGMFEISRHLPVAPYSQHHADAALSRLRRRSSATPPTAINTPDPGSGTLPAAELAFQPNVPPAVVNVATQIPVLKSEGFPSFMMPLPVNSMAFVVSSGSVKVDNVKVKVVGPTVTSQSGDVAGIGNCGGLNTSGEYMVTGVFAGIAENEPFAPEFTTDGPKSRL